MSLISLFLLSLVACATSDDGVIITPCLNHGHFVTIDHSKLKGTVYVLMRSFDDNQPESACETFTYVMKDREHYEREDKLLPNRTESFSSLEMDKNDMKSVFDLVEVKDTENGTRFIVQGSHFTYYALEATDNYTLFYGCQIEENRPKVFLTSEKKSLSEKDLMAVNATLTIFGLEGLLLAEIQQIGCNWKSIEVNASSVVNGSTIQGDHNGQASFGVQKFMVFLGTMFCIYALALVQ